MTNTRITDPEILEKRYLRFFPNCFSTNILRFIRFPVVLSRFCLREGSGGKGQYRGGDGVDRRILFRRPLTLSILTERRVHQPYGLAGGGNGQSGKNLLQLRDGRMINLGGKCSVTMQAGVSISLSSTDGSIGERISFPSGYVHPSHTGRRWLWQSGRQGWKGCIEGNSRGST